jgi:hypothetical protein
MQVASTKNRPATFSGTFWARSAIVLGAVSGQVSEASQRMLVRLTAES